MANERYDYFNERLLTGKIDWTTQAFKVVLIDTGNYVPLKAVHRHLADIPAVARLATSASLTGMTAAGGRAMADSVTVGPVYGQDVKAMVIYHDTGTEATSELVVYLDTAQGLPFTPQGLSVVISWDGGPNGIFVL